MLLIPMDRKLDWRQPPVLTLLLALCSILVFVLFQSGDGERHRSAMAYYQSSGLMALELERYQEHLRIHDAGNGLLEATTENASPYVVFWRILRDEDFAHRLLEGEVITVTEAEFSDWRRARGDLHRQLDEITFWRFGLRPGDLEPETLLTHIFLHADIFHLLGNLLFLIALGMLVEFTVGWHRMLAIYLLGGILVGAADLLLTPERLIPGVGASGAIAVLMGLYAVLFGLQRVRFFYFIGVYFNYTRAPALILLPLWLGWELLNWIWLSADSNTHYGAHTVGLALGALAGVGLRLAWPAAINRDFVREAERREQAGREAALVERYLQELDFDRALPLLERQLQREPGNPAILHRLHRCLRPQPQSERYHRLSHELLSLGPGGSDVEAMVLDVYRDYSRRARPRPRLNGRTVQALALRFARANVHGEAGELGRMVAARKLPDAPAVLVALAEMHLRAGHPERAQPWLERLLGDHAATREAEYGRGLLRRIHTERPHAAGGARSR